MIPNKFNGYAPDGRRRCFKGGGGSGGGQVYYANQDKLLGTQADIAQGIYNNIYQPYAPGAVSQLSGLVDEANSGALTDRARAQAGADAGAATGQALEASDRNLARYGLDPHRFAADSNAAALSGAAIKADAMNKAEQWGEGQKWGRTYDFYNSLAGVPSQSAAMLGNSAFGYGQMGGNMTALDMANARGYGQAGSALAYGLFRKDGGFISARVRPARRIGLQRRIPLDGVPPPNKMPQPDGLPRFAGGGLMKLPDWRGRSTAGSLYPQAPDALSSMVSGAAPMVAGELLKPVIKPYAEAAKGALTGMFKAEPGSIINNPISADAVASPVADSAPELIGASAGDAAADTAASAATAAAADTAASAAAEDALPMILTALTAKDGGAIGMRRKDLRTGGRVRGPGGPTEDKVPAWLSNGEYVLNAEATQMVGKNKLDAVNRKGLQRRAQNGGRVIEGSARRVREPHFGLGGMLGVAMGAGVDQWDRDQETTLKQQTDARAQQSHDLAMRMGNLQADEYQSALDAQRQIRAAGAKALAAPTTGGPSGDAATNGTPPANPAPTQADTAAPVASPAMSPDPNAPASALGDLAPPQSTPALSGGMIKVSAPATSSGAQTAATPGASPTGAGLSRTDDLSVADGQFKVSKAMYEAAMQAGRADLAQPYYEQMLKNRDTLLARANDRADRIYQTTGNLSGYVNNYNNYVADGQTIDGYRQNADGSLTVSLNRNGETSEHTVPKDQVGQYVMSLRDPAAVRGMEAQLLLKKGESDIQENAPSTKAKADYFEAHAQSVKDMGQAALQRAQNGGANGMAGPRFDEKQIGDFVKEGEGFYSFPSALPGEKPQVSMTGKTLYSALLRAQGKEAADARMLGLLQKSAGKNGAPDVGAYEAGARQIMSNLYRPAPPAANPATAPADLWAGVDDAIAAARKPSAAPSSAPASAPPPPAPRGMARTAPPGDENYVNLEPAGKTFFGTPQFVATYKDGTRKLVSGGMTYTDWMTKYRAPAQ